MTYWTTKYGERIPIEELSDGHLDNIIRFIERKAEEGIIIGDLGLLADDGPCADKIYGQEVFDLYPYRELIAERERRKKQSKEAE